MNFEFRYATLDDLETLTQMRLEMRRERESTPLTIPEKEFEQITRDYFAKALTSGDFVTCIAFCGKEAAAHCSACVHVHAPSYGNLTGKTAYLFNMYTRPAFRRQGLAVKLLDLLKEWGRAQGCSKLGMNASPAGKGIYLKYGYRDVVNEMEMSLQALE